MVIDETSMLDLSLAAKLLDAISPGTRVIFVGDPDQLPSIGAGNVLQDMMASKVIPHARLDKIKRQNPGAIIENCHRIRIGEDIELDPADPGSDMHFLPCRDSDPAIREARAVDLIVDLVCRRLPKAYGVDSKRDIQVLTPLREKTKLSCKDLNLKLQDKLSASDPIERSRFRIGDKVIQLKNDYGAGILNGDIGYVLDSYLGPDRKVVLAVEFQDPKRRVEVDVYENNLDLAYAITVHKFLGSECPIVIVPIFASFGSMIMQRNWLYTAVSRAKRVCILVGERGEVRKIVRRHSQGKRMTGLAARIEGML